MAAAAATRATKWVASKREPYAKREPSSKGETAAEGETLKRGASIRTACVAGRQVDVATVSLNVPAQHPRSVSLDAFKNH